MTKIERVIYTAKAHTVKDRRRYSTQDRRSFLRKAAAGLAVAARCAHASTTLANIGYMEAGPADGRAVILLHGWPYDIHNCIDVVPLLAAEGCRVIVPDLRGYGTTWVHSEDTFLNGQQAAVGHDIVALMDALRIDKAIVGGFDWGSHTAVIMATLWPERCRAMVAVNGYLITNVSARMAKRAASSYAG